jgi:hypothetical protein
MQPRITDRPTFTEERCQHVASHYTALGIRPLVWRNFATQSGQTALRNGKDYFQLLLDILDDVYKMQMLLMMSEFTAKCNLVQRQLRIYMTSGNNQRDAA